jgi:adenine/guanine phosphoribosyltransferase-like PRPP-binding protein
MNTEVVTAHWPLPRFLDCGRAQGLYDLLSASSHEPLDTLLVDMTKCEWVEHFELQKLAAHLSAARGTVQTLMLRVPDTSLAGGRAGDVISYATASGFFSYLSESFRANLKIVRGSSPAFPFDPYAFAAYVATLREQSKPTTQRRPSAAHVGGYPYSTLPMQSIGDWHSVDDITDLFATGQQLQDILKRHGTLDVVASGEFATLIVNEVSENVVEHAFAGQTGGAAAISVTTVQLGNRTDPDSRISTRLKVAPEYEQDFLRASKGAVGYLELTISDTGVGIVESLRARPDLHEGWFGHKHAPSEEELLAAAFHPHVTRDPGPHRPGLRGLFYVAECVADYGGVVVCEANDLRLVLRPEIRSPGAADVIRCEQSVHGTHLRILIPIEPTRRTREEWERLNFSEPSSLGTASVSQQPIVRGLPAAIPLRDPRRREALVNFGKDCCAALKAPAADTANDLVWLSAGQTRRWRKQHIQVFLEELRHHESQRAITIVNVPATVAIPMAFIARHLLGSNDQQTIIIVDENARRAVVSQQLAATRSGFTLWAQEPFGYMTGDFTPAGTLMAVITGHFRSQYHHLSFNDATFLASRIGIDTEFSNVLASFRDNDTRIAIDDRTVIQGYLELDEATRHPDYTRALGACVDVAVANVFRADGVIALSRAATRLLEHRGIHFWSMATPEDSLPSVKWWSKHQRVCIVTDVIARGRGIATLITRARAMAANTLDPPTIVGIVAPVVASSQPALPGTLLHASDTGPRLAWLAVTELITVPLLWIHQSRTSLIHVEAGEPVSRPEARTNLLPQATRQLNDGATPDTPVPAFIRAIEQRDALWFGHVEINDTHFDLEVDMTRLFAGSEALADYANRIAQYIVEQQIDLILYPDESRIQLATATAIDDALERRGAPMPLLLRAHHGARGDLFLAKADWSHMRTKQRALIIDDAINTSKTTKELLQLVTAVAPDLMSVTVYPFISREPDPERNFLRALPQLHGAAINWREFVRLPLAFWSKDDCPLCQRARFARAAAIIASPLLQRTLLKFAKRVRPAVYGSDREPETSRGTGAVRLAIPNSTTEHFATLAGACAAMAAMISEHVVDARMLLSILLANRYPAELAAFAIYVICSRCGPENEIWRDDTFRATYFDVARSLAKQRGKSIEDAGHADPILLLTLSAWFAPADTLPALFAALMRAAAPLLEHNTYFEEAVVLALRIGETELAEGAKRDLHDALDPNRINAEVQRKQGHENAPSITLMRLRHIIQVAFREPIEQPWIEGVAHVLSILSYETGHPRIGLINEESVTFARAALEDASVAESETGEAKEEAVRLFHENLRALLAAPTTDIEFLETSLRPAFGTWFRALQFQHEWRGIRTPHDLIDELAAIERRITNLRRAVRRAERSYGSTDVQRTAEAITLIAENQEALNSMLMGTAQEGIRHIVEGYLTPMSVVLQRHAAVDMQRLLETDAVISFKGSFFDAADIVRRGEKVPWTVVIAPTETLEDILLNALVRNPEQHVARHLPGKAIEVHAELTDLRDGTQAVTIRIQVRVDGSAIALDDHILMKTLGRRKQLLKLCGGDITVDADAAGMETELVISLAAGHY